MGNSNIYLDKAWFILLSCTMTFPIIPKGIESILVISFVLLSIVVVYERGNRKVKFLSFKKLSLLVVLQSLFFIYIISLIYSKDVEEGLSHVTRILPIFFFPLVFGVFRKNILEPKQLDALKKIYVFSVLCCLVYINFCLFEDLYLNKTTQWEIRQLIENRIDVHGTYLSIWVGFGVMILLSLMEKARALKLKKRIVLYFLIIVFFIYWQLTIGARMPWIITLLLTFLFLIYNLKSRLRSIVCVMLIIIIFVLLNKTKSDLVDRVKSVVSLEFSLPQGDYNVEYKNISSEDIRRGIFYCSWFLLEKSPIVGYGVGDVQSNLDRCYQEKINSNVYQKFLYNTHNQYFQVILSGGLLASLFFLASLIVPLYIAYKKSDYLLFSLTILIMACCVTENVLNRQDGIIFYSLFNSLLIFNNSEKYEKGLGA